MNVLELFSGIGGMHMALKAAGIDGEVVAAIDINTTANSVYSHNFPKINLLNRNIQAISSKFINDLKVNVILMSPPCQPFTRNGLQRDTLDSRTSSFIHLLDILPDLKINYILMENVKGFESSDMRDMFIKSLTENNFLYQEFLLSPTYFGIPNSRTRYYCLAKRKPLEFHFTIGELKEYHPLEKKTTDLTKIYNIIDKNINTEEYLIPDNTLKKHSNLLDICTENSTNSCCFTKAYGRYIEGTGSVFTTKTESDIHETYQQIKTLDPEDQLKCVKELQLRFFTPNEVSRLMSFPESFTFPDNLSNKQKYRLLGNSINVKVVSELIKLLLN